ncbi:MAG: family 16 glycosylhydrolase [Bacteroidota bacterium]|nr:family 16 glycosylhydrolase [Bacteroidota bacterium]
MIMKKYLFFATVALLFITAYGCGGKKDATVPDTAPTNLTVTANVSADSSGNVSFTATATNAVSYDYDFGNGVFQTVPSGNVTYKYPSSGNYTVNVVAKSAGGKTASQSVQITVTVKLSLVWSDEFNTPGSPDASKWGYDLGGGGWGNNELEYYTSRTDNAFVSNGTLKIIAKKESYGGSNYTSARLLTKGLYSFQYGRIDVSAKLPATTGTWPAIWMLGNNISTAGWPACGEIDIMEQNGSNKNIIYGTMHYPTQANPNGDGGTTQVSSAVSAFHKYSAIWSATSIQLLVDDVVYYTLPNSSKLPFNQNFFMILNLAIGGNFGGSVDPNFVSDQMEIDYVRVYQ